MPATLVKTSEGPVNIVVEFIEKENRKKWDGATWVVFFRHAEKLHIAFAWDGFEKLVDALREAQWFERHPILVGKWVTDWMNDPYKV